MKETRRSKKKNGGARNGGFYPVFGKTKSEAITKACIELGTSSDQLEIQVVSEGSSGFFGLGSKPAIIKVRKIEEVSEDAEIEKLWIL